jgi:HK97 family phage major capsid protein
MQELRDKRVKLVADARALMEKDDPSAEEGVQFDAMMNEADKLKAEIDRLERADRTEAELNTSRSLVRAGREDSTVLAAAEAEAEKALELEAFHSYLRVGLGMMPDHLRAVAQRKMAPIKGQQATTPGSAGGYLVPQGFVNRLEIAMLAYGGMREASTIMPTDSGGPMPWPTENDTTNEGEIVAENTAVTEQTIAFGQVMFGSYMYSSKMVRTSLQILQDSAFPFDTWLPDRLAERLARITNRHFTLGTGAPNQPAGIVPSATLGNAAATGGSTSVSTDNLIDLEHSVDPAYREGAKFMFHDNTLRDIKKLKDSQGRFLWIPGLAATEPDTILGYPYVINQHMAPMAASAKSILFGRLDKYVIRDVLGVQIMRLTERYAEFLQVGFLAFLRCDGHLIDAGTHPVRYFSNSAT